MSKLSPGRILTMTAGGAAGGLLTYLLLEPYLRSVEIASERQQQIGVVGENIREAFASAMLLGAVLSLTIGAALIFVEECRSRSPLRIARLVFIGAVVGAMCGTIGGAGGELLFSVLLSPFASSGQPAIGMLIIARAIGWALVGAGAGLCPGVVSRSGQRIRQGIVGGLLGGGLGGLLFDGISVVTQTGSLSRAIGFVSIGGAVGALVSLIEESAKTHWLTVLNGAKEGRSFILSRPRTFLGRDELSDIPLFGDATVQKQHALLTLLPNGVLIAAQPGSALTVNGQPTAQTPLADGDVLGIGRHRLLFRSRKAALAVAGAISPEQKPLSSLSPEAASLYSATAFPDTLPTLMPQAGMQAAMPHLEVIGGPHAGAVFPVTPGAIIGRDPRCDIPLLNDAHISRQHARLMPEGGAWRIEDGGSANGLHVNGQRVSSQLLQPGDQVGIGNSLLRLS